MIETIFFIYFFMCVIAVAFLLAIAIMASVSKEFRKEFIEDWKKG